MNAYTIIEIIRRRRERDAQLAAQRLNWRVLNRPHY
jgi:hypothetical protein